MTTVCAARRSLPLAALLVASAVHMTAFAQAHATPAARTAQLTDDGIEAQESEDCAPDAGGRCTRTTTTNIGASGLRIESTREAVVAVHAPISGANQSGFSLALLLGSGDNLELVGGTFGAQLRMLNGETFPGVDGGGWLGFFVEPAAQVSVMNSSVTTPGTCYAAGRCTSTTTADTTSGSAMLAATAGLQYMHFDAMDAATRVQSGLGLAVGVQGAAMIPFEDGETTTSYGPAFSLLKPTYNPGTARLETDSLNVFILPSESLFMMMIGYSSSVN